MKPSVTPAPNQRSDQAKAQRKAIQQKGKGGIGGFVSEWTGPSLEHLLATGHISSPGGTALDIASFLPVFRGPRALLNGVRAIKGAEDVAKAAKDTSAAEEMLRSWKVDIPKTIKPTVQKGAAPTAKTLGETVTGALHGARGTRATQEALRSEERAARIKAYGTKAQADPSLAGHRAAKSELAGKYAELPFGGFKDFTQETLDAMSKHITDHPELREFDKVRGKDALVKISDGKVPTKSEEKILRKVFGNATTGKLMKSVSVWRKVGQHGLDVANLPRAVQSSIDVSGAGRQALLMATGHPVVWAKNLGPMFKAFTSEDYYVKKMAELHQEDIVTSGVADQMGLQLSELSPKAGTSMREEPFASPLAEKIPGVRMSSRSFTYLVDKSRVDLAKILYAKAVKDAGRQIPRLRTDGKLIPKWVNEPINPEDPELLSSIGKFANSATGRGDLGHGKIGNSADVINLIFYSPRLIKSRIDFLNPVWYARLHPIARHEAYRAIAGLAGLVMFADAVAHEAGASVNLDPRSSDFAKIKVGNTRIDLAGGFNQYIRVLAETVTMQTVSQSGKTVPLAPFRAKGTAPNAQSIGAIYLRFLRNKLAPVASGTVDVGLGANTVGQPVGWNTLTSRFTPLAIQDAVSVGKDAHGLGAEIGAGLGAYGLAGFGLGVQNYKPKVPKSTGSGGSGFWDGGSSGGSGSFWGK